MFVSFSCDDGREKRNQNNVPFVSPFFHALTPLPHQTFALSSCRTPARLARCLVPPPSYLRCCVSTLPPAHSLSSQSCLQHLPLPFSYLFFASLLLACASFCRRGVSLRCAAVRQRNLSFLLLNQVGRAPSRPLCDFVVSV